MREIPRDGGGNKSTTLPPLPCNSSIYKLIFKFTNDFFQETHHIFREKQTSFLSENVLFYSLFCDAIILNYRAKVKSLGSQLRAIRKEEYYPNGEYGAKREEGMFDLANEWPSPNSDMHEEFSEDPNSRRIQQKIFQAMREATTAVLKETRSDIEGMAVQDGRHQREKKPFLSKTERGGYPNNKRSKLHSAGMRYQHEMMEPPQDPQGYAMDPAAVHYPFLPMVCLSIFISDVHY